VAHLTHKPTERIIVHQPIGLDSLGSTFNAEAPFSACRLCGVLYQSEADLEQYNMWVTYERFSRSVIEEYPEAFKRYKVLEEKAFERRIRWRVAHYKRYHTDAEVDSLIATGFAFTPEATYKLTSYGIFPIGNMHEEIIDAMATAPRAPEQEHES
jgi:hypothetical protein